MFESQLLIRGTDESHSVYSPWFPRGGNNLRATLEVVNVSGATLKVEVFTKESDETGDGDNAQASTSISESTAGRSTKEWTSLSTAGTVSTIEDMVRYKFTISGSNAADWVLFRMLPPVWFDTVGA